MRERFKSILLFFLVVTSLFLTQKIWIKLPDTMAKRLNPIVDTYADSYALSDMITPHKYVINFGNKDHTLFYGDNKYHIWDDTKKILSQVLSSENITTEEIKRDQYLNLKEERSLIIYFPEEISTYILAKTWGVEDPNNITDAMPNIDETYIYLGTEDPFFVFSYKDNYLLISGNKIDTASLTENLTEIDISGNYDRYHTIREAYQIDNDIYIPNKMENNLPTVYFSNEISVLDDAEKRQVAARFFKEEMDYTREIVENNGSTIYMYNNKSLKLNINGTLEYFHSIEEKVPDRNLYISLITAAEFIKDKSSSLEGIYLSNIEEIENGENLGFRLKFKYRVRNIPVILGNREFGDYIEMDVYNNHVRSYKLLARSEMDLDLNMKIENRKVLSSFDVLDRNYDFLVREYLASTEKTLDFYKDLGNDVLRDDVLSKIEDISLAYYDPNLKDKNEKLIGVWVIAVDKKVYAFSVHTGDFVFGR